MPTGIEGFDEITSGGLPRNRTTLLMGGPGCGKTVFALQTLVNGIHQWNEPSIFVAFEENAGQIVANAATFGWDIASEEQQKMFFLDTHLSPAMVRAGDFGLPSLLPSIEVKAKEMGAKRIVFDGIDVLLTLLNDPAAERYELFNLRDWVSQNGLTCLLTAKTEESGPFLGQWYGVMQFMTDCVIRFDHSQIDRVSLREIRVVKYCGSGFASNKFPFVIGPTGIDVMSPSLDEPDHPVFTDRVSSGIERLDTMLGGGYFRGSSVLITGVPGTAKSTLAGAFAEAACRREEKTLYISFDEVAGQIVRNLSSVGIHMRDHVQSGVLRIYSSQIEGRNAEEHIVQLKKIIREQKPRCVVMDPISAIIRSGSSALDIAKRLIYMCKVEGITLVCTCLIKGSDPEAEETKIEVSTIADTWIQLSYVINAGERNRALSIIKSRGMKHSNQVRELILSETGVTLSDVYTAGGEVLMGTLRWEKEAAEQVEREILQAERNRKRSDLQLASAAIQAQIEALRCELETRQADLNLLDAEEKGSEQLLDAHQKDLLKLRDSDALASSQEKPRTTSRRGKTKPPKSSP
jgi:circadian clock protein KaiC